MRKNISDFLSGLKLAFLGSVILGLGFGGVVLLGKVTSAFTDGNSSALIETLFIFIYGTYLFALCWLTGKFIIPKYYN